MSEIYVPVVPASPTNGSNRVRNSCNAVQVTVNYSKGQGIVASAYPVELKANGIVIALIASGEYAVLQKATRLNRGRVDQERELARVAIAHKAGAVWDLVQKVCEQNGLTTEVYEPHYDSAGSDPGDDPDYVGY